MRRVNNLCANPVRVLTVVAGLGLSLSPPAASAAPTAEVAKRCLHYAYIVYPFKRPGAVPMSGDRQAYFKDCIAKDGDIPAPTPQPKPSGASREKGDASSAKSQ